MPSRRITERSGAAGRFGGTYSVEIVFTSISGSFPRGSRMIRESHAANIVPSYTVTRCSAPYEGRSRSRSNSNPPRTFARSNRKSLSPMAPICQRTRTAVGSKCGRKCQKVGHLESLATTPRGIHRQVREHVVFGGHTREHAGGESFTASQANSWPVTRISEHARMAVERRDDSLSGPNRHQNSVSHF